MDNEFPAFLVHQELYEGTKRLSDTELGKLFRGMMQYSFGDGMPDLTGREGPVFDLIRPMMDKERKKFMTRGDTSRENGKKGGRPRKKPETQQDIPGTQENPLGFSGLENNPPYTTTTNNTNNTDCKYTENGNKQGFITDDEIELIQRNLNRVFDAASCAGFDHSGATLDKINDLAAIYPTDWILKAIDECVEYSAVNLAYLRSVLEAWQKAGGITEKSALKKRTASGTPIDINAKSRRDDI